MGCPWGWNGMMKLIVSQWIIPENSLRLALKWVINSNTTIVISIRYCISPWKSWIWKKSHPEGCADVFFLDTSPVFMASPATFQSFSICCFSPGLSKMAGWEIHGNPLFESAFKIGEIIYNWGNVHWNIWVPHGLNTGMILSEWSAARKFKKISVTFPTTYPGHIF